VPSSIKLIPAADANLFKEAFMKAQQDNEALFGKDEKVSGEQAP